MTTTTSAAARPERPRSSGSPIWSVRLRRALRTGFSRAPASISTADFGERLLVGGDDLLRQRREVEVGAEFLAGADRVGDELLQRFGLFAFQRRDHVGVGRDRVGVRGRGG